MELSILLILVIVICSCKPEVSEEEADFSNSWAVEIHGGLEVADDLAKKHGFINKGQVGSLASVYHFVHVFSPNLMRRSIHEYHPKHHVLMDEEKVGYVQQQVLKKRFKRDVGYTYSVQPSANWNKLWYLHRSSGQDMNVEVVWQHNFTGRGVVVSVLDDGIEYTHPDLQGNYDPLASYDLNGGDNDPFPRYDLTNENKHGTRCAGEVVASWAGRCCVGAAFHAKIGGVRMLDGNVNDVVEASALSLNPQHIHIYSSSWGPNDDGQTVDGPGELAKKAFINGTAFGRNGLGSIFVWAAGNGGRFEDSCNCDGYAVSPLTISVGSASERNHQPWYLEQCSSTLVSTYSSGGFGEKQIISTDLHGQCTEGHTGTSASAPLAAGMLALALEANPLLTWRDVQYLLVYSSNSAYFRDDLWQVNGAGLRVSHWYGFGIIDGEALVNRARNWATVPSQSNCTLNLTSTLGGGEMATSRNSLVVNIHVENCELSALEHVQAITSISIHDGKRKDISILLTSPAGTKALLLPFRAHDLHKEGFHLWPFMSVQSWGEGSNGDWVFTIELKEGSRVELEALELVLYGSNAIPSSIQAIPSTCHSQCSKGCSQYGPQFCDSCKYFQMATSFECVGKCPDGTYINGKICHDCPSLCTTCIGIKSCNSCRLDNYLLKDGSCSPSCSSGTFSTSNRMCVSCHQSCMSCIGPLNTSCLSCHSQFLLLNHTCVIREPSSCSVGEYFDHRSHECHSCHETCASCIGRDNNQCSSCFSSRRLSQDGICIDSRYVRSCSHGHYFSTSNFECTACPTVCSNCSDNQTCTSCHDGYFKTQGGSCVGTCPWNTTTDLENQLCVENVCHYSCLKCSHHKSTHCTSCHKGQLLVENQCLNECPSQFYEHLTTCQKCYSHCESCNGPLKDQCLSCSSERFFLNHTCVKTCPVGTFGIQYHCVSCIKNCSNCSTEHSCDLCNDNYYFLSSNTPKCTHDCPESYFRHLATRTCRQCQSHCDECYDALSCHHCIEDYFYYAPNRSCLKQCPDGYYSSERTCIPCQLPCSTCNVTSLNCSSCSHAMALHKESRKCIKCCNRDEMTLPCCDCSQSDRYCLLSTFTTTSAVIQTSSVSYTVQLIALAVVIALFILLAIIAVINVLFRRNCRNKSQTRYQVLSSEDFDFEQNKSEEL